MKQLSIGPAVNAARYLKHRFIPRKSYAADLEDLAALLLLGKVKLLIDVGANDGTSVSNTALAALHGARGLCFEPNPRDYQRLSEFYRFSPGIECIEEGISDEPGTVDLRSDGLLSAIAATEDQGLTKLLSPYYSTNSQTVTIKVDTLSAWLDRRPDFQRSDLLSIDVEGHELNVLHGIDWSRHAKPARCFIVETHSRGPAESWEHRDYARICELMELRHYINLAATANNTIWLHRDDYDPKRIAEARSQFAHYKWAV